MTTALKPMTRAEYEDYRQHSIPNYARNKVESGEWAEETSMEQAAEVYDELLPDGVDTPGHYLFQIIDEWDEVPVGVIWIASRDRAGQQAAYIYDVFIKPEYQSKGHASRAIKAVQDKALDMGLPGIGLHVFGHNENARRLYEKLGYEPVNVFMYKRLVNSGL